MSINRFGYPSLPSLVSPYKCSFSSRYKLLSNRPLLETFGGSNKKVKGDLTRDNTEKILAIKSRVLLQIKYQTHCPTSKHIKSSQFSREQGTDVSKANRCTSSGSSRSIADQRWLMITILVRRGSINIKDISTTRK